MPPKRKATKQSTNKKKKQTLSKNKSLHAQFLEEEKKRIAQVDEHMLKFLESTCYENYQKNDDKRVQSYDEFCYLMMDVLTRKKRKYELEQVPRLVKALPPEIVAYSIVPFMDLESVLNGSVFLVCRAWYEGMIDEDRMWQELFCRLWDLTVENCNNWTRWPTTFDTNDFFLSEINRATIFTTKPTALKKKSKDMMEKHSYTYLKEFCLLKHASFKKHSKIGDVRGFFSTTHNESNYTNTTLIGPSLYSKFHITSLKQDKLTFISVSDDGSLHNRLSTIHFTLDYYTARIPFSMEIHIDSRAYSYEEKDMDDILISVSRLHIESDLKKSQTKLILMKRGDVHNDIDEDDEGDIEENEEQDERQEEKDLNVNSISTFKNEWVGEDFVKINNDNNWLFRFISTLGIDLMDEALYRMNDY